MFAFKKTKWRMSFEFVLRLRFLHSTTHNCTKKYTWLIGSSDRIIWLFLRTTPICVLLSSLRALRATSSHSKLYRVDLLITWSQQQMFTHRNLRSQCARVSRADRCANDRCTDSYRSSLHVRFIRLSRPHAAHILHYSEEQIRDMDGMEARNAEPSRSSLWNGTVCIQFLVNAGRWALESFSNLWNSGAASIFCSPLVRLTPLAAEAAAAARCQQPVQ